MPVSLWAGRSQHVLASVWIISSWAFNGLQCSVYFNDNVKFNLPSFFHISFCKVNWTVQWIEKFQEKGKYTSPLLSLLLNLVTTAWLSQPLWQDFSPRGPESFSKDLGRSNRTFQSPFIHGYFCSSCYAWAERNIQSTLDPGCPARLIPECLNQIVKLCQPGWVSVGWAEGSV